MPPLSASALLDAWERGRAHGPLERAALLLAAACPAMPPGQLGTLPIGRRDGLLRALREATFGSRIASVAVCPACGEQLELAFDHADLNEVDEAANTGTDIMMPSQVALDDYTAQFRCATSDDLAALATAGAAGAAASALRLALLGRCVLDARHGAAPVPVASLPAHVIDAIDRQMAAADPGADLRLALACPACGHQWQAVFDIVSFFWSELDAWAGRLLRDVHTLARAYGWTERDILALSPSRRRCYLDMVGA